MTASSEAANAPRHRGEAGFYEIWFVVVFEIGARRATWLRYTIFTPAPGCPGEPRGIVWAASFDARADPPAFAEKAIYPMSAVDLGDPSAFHVRVGDSVIGHGFCRGAVATPARRIEWDLRFTPAEREAVRTPRIAEHLPLPAHVAHANDRVPFEGWIEIDGVRRVLDRAVGTQTHLWGTRRVEALTWIRAPAFVEDPSASLEVIAARPRARGPGTTSLHLAHQGGAVDLVDLPFAVTNRATAHVRDGAAIVDVRAASPRTVVRVRARCDPRTLVGYVYRDPRGSDLFVAQSDLATCDVEVYARRGLVAAPERRLSCVEGAALELHGPEPLAGVDYVAWDDVTVRAAPRAPARRSAPSPAPREASFEDLPPVHAIVALGLTYRDHVRETASGGAPVAFMKHRASLLLEGERVVVPSQEAILEALDEIEPGLARTLASTFAFVPAILDYEAELAMIVLEATPRAELADARFVPRVGWAVANDLTARSCQVLGAGAPDPLHYWSAAKSFPGFLPMTSRVFVPASRRDEIPDVTLTLRVNGEIRQEARATELLYRPRELARRAAAALGRDLDRGDVVLTGTPAGVAFAISRARRWIGERFLDRTGRLRAAIAMAASSERFLAPGDVVEVRAGFLGRRVVEIVSG